MAILLPDGIELERIDLTEAEGCIATFTPR